MKTQTKIRAAGLLLLSLIFQFTFASPPGGSVMGKVIDPETKEAVDGATVVFDNKGTQVVFYTNQHGYYYASNIPAGVYTVTVRYLSKSVTLADIIVGNDEQRNLDIALSTALEMGPVTIGAKRGPNGPLIDPLEPQKDMIRRTDFKDYPIVNIAGLTAARPAVVEGNKGEYYVRGARSGDLAYYIDGCKIMGTPNIPLCGLDTYRMYSNYIPAKYGDALGGVVVMETRNFFSEQ